MTPPASSRLNPTDCFLRQETEWEFPLFKGALQIGNDITGVGPIGANGDGHCVYWNDI